MTASTNVLEMGLVSEKSASVIRAISAGIVIHYAQGMAHAITTPVSVKVNGRVNTAKFQNVLMTVQAMAYVTAHFLLAFVTQDGAERTAANLTVQVNRIVMTEVHVQ